jgi:hypothetical protein
MYIHERKEWPDFEWEQGKLTALLADVRLCGRLGRMEGLGFELPVRPRCRRSPRRC